MKKCKSGYYYCNTDKKCKPIPRGYRVGYGGYLRKEKDDDDSKNKSNGNGNGNGNGSNGNGNGGNGSGGNGGGGNGGGMGEEVTHEAVAAIPAIAGASKVIPAVVAGVGALGTIMQAKRSQDTKASRGRRSEKPKRKLSAAEKKIFDMQKKDIMQKGSDEFSTKGLIKRNEKFTKQTTRGTTNKPENQFHTEDAIPTNNASSGNIEGLPPDDPPVKKKKKTYAYGGRGSRKMWMNNK